MKTATGTEKKRFDIEKVRADFPVLNETVHGKPLVYLDNAATTQRPREVVRGVCQVYGTCNANVHRAYHYMGELATQKYEAARKKAAGFLNAASTSEIIFTRGTTEGINLVAYTWGRQNIKAGDAILVTEMEHHSNFIPWQQLALETGAELRVVPVNANGSLSRVGWEEMLDNKVKLAAFTHTSNVLGTVNPVQQMTEQAKAVGAKVLIDAAQGAAHGPIDVQKLGCDFLALSAHKLCGPTGVGVLYGKRELLEEMPPFLFGGEMVDQVSIERTTFAELPYKFEGGTPNIAGVIGFGAAIDYLEELGWDAIQARERELVAYARERFHKTPTVRLYGNAKERCGAFSFALEGVHPHDIAQWLDAEGIAIRAGHMCAQPLMKKLGVPALSRASLYFYNTEQEIDALFEALEKTRRFFA